MEYNLKFIIVVFGLFIIFLIEKPKNNNTKPQVNAPHNNKDLINQSIIDGFFDSDTTGIGDNIYLLR